MVVAFHVTGVVGYSVYTGEYGTVVPRLDASMRIVRPKALRWGQAPRSQARWLILRDSAHGGSQVGGLRGTVSRPRAPEHRQWIIRFCTYPEKGEAGDVYEERRRHGVDSGGAVVSLAALGDLVGRSACHPRRGHHDLPTQSAHSTRSLLKQIWL